MKGSDTSNAASSAIQGGQINDLHQEARSNQGSAHLPGCARPECCDDKAVGVDGSVTRSQDVSEDISASVFSPAREDDLCGTSVTVESGNEVVASASSERNSVGITDGRKSPITPGRPCLGASAGDNDNLGGGDLVCDATDGFSLSEGNPVPSTNGDDDDDDDGKPSSDVESSMKEMAHGATKAAYGTYKDALTGFASLFRRGKPQPKESHKEGDNLMELVSVDLTSCSSIFRRSVLRLDSYCRSDGSQVAFHGMMALLFI